ncbi:hypothetical protein BDW71DRAFT_12728 [Aspergillus fruticulosus]
MISINNTLTPYYILSGTWVIMCALSSSSLKTCHLYLCRSLYAQYINNLFQTCSALHLRLNWALWELGAATAQDLSSAPRDAASRGSLASIQKLFELSVDHDFTVSDDTVHRALMAAARAAHDNVVGVLLTTGVDYRLDKKLKSPSWDTDIKSDSALQITAQDGHLSVVCLLLGHGATVDDKAVALDLGVLSEHEESARKLLDKEDGLQECFI